MKITFIVSGFFPYKLAGAELAAYNTTKSLAKLGHEVHVISTQGHDLPAESREEGLYVHRIRVVRKRFLYPVTYFINSLTVLRKINPDLLQIQGLFWIPTAYLIKIVLRIPIIVRAQGSDVYYPASRLRRFYPYLLKKADAVVVLTNDMSNALRNICDREIVIIPTGIDLDSHVPLPRNEARTTLGMKLEEVIILFVGRLHPIKGVNYLLEAMEIIKRSVPNIRLMIVGDGKERERLEERSEQLRLVDIVTFVGQVPNNRVHEYMSAGDVFVLPSLSEGFANVNLEAMAAGLPIIATRVRGIPEFIIDRKNGFLVNPGDATDLADKLLVLIKDRELRTKISKQNLKDVKKYSLDNIARQLEGVYHQVTESSK